MWIWEVWLQEIWICKGMRLNITNNHDVEAIIQKHLRCPEHRLLNFMKLYIWTNNVEWGFNSNEEPKIDETWYASVVGPNNEQSILDDSFDPTINKRLIKNVSMRVFKKKKMIMMIMMMMKT